MRRLFTGNLPYDATAAQLKEWFAAGGIETVSVSLQVDQLSGRSRGFAYVVVPPDTAKTAVREFNGREFRGRTLVVSEAPEPAGGEGRSATILARQLQTQ